MNESKKLREKYRIEQQATIIRERIGSGKKVNEWDAENSISRHKYSAGFGRRNSIIYPYKINIGKITKQFTYINLTQVNFRDIIPM